MTIATEPDRWFAAVLAGSALGLLALVVWPTPLLRILPASVAYVQFPWRALAPVAAATSLLWFLVLRGSRHAGRTLVAVGLVAVALVPAAQRRPWTRPDITDACFTRGDARAPADPVAGACFRAAGLGYLPDAGDEPSSRRGRSGRGWTTGNDYLPTQVDEHDPYAGVVAEPTVTAGSARVEAWRRTGTGLVATVVADGSATVRLPATAYRFVRVGSDRGTLPRADADGTVAVRVPDGRTTITVGRRRTPAELTGAAITLLTVAGAAALAVRRRRAARRARVLT